MLKMKACPKLATVLFKYFYDAITYKRGFTGDE
jgi:hypothetical protein